MVKLSEFVGEMISELSKARQMADAASVQLSQSYHADAFLKEMPVPHYTIDEAEVSFPLAVVEMSSDTPKDIEDNILTAIKLKLPAILLQALREAYVNKREQERENEEKEQKAKQYRNQNNSEQKADAKNQRNVKLDDKLSKQYRQSTDAMCVRLRSKMMSYLNGINLEVTKLLDIKDIFIDMLQKEYIEEFMTNKYNSATRPIADDDDDALASLILSVANNLFFEFVKTNVADGILIDPTTGRLNEYNSKDSMLQIKLKIKEQDLDLVIVEEPEKRKTKRFLSLS